MSYYPLQWGLWGRVALYYHSHSTRPGNRLCHGGVLFWGLAPSWVLFLHMYMAFICLSVYLPIWAQKKLFKNREGNRRRHIKKMDLNCSNAYMRIRYRAKEITALRPEKKKFYSWFLRDIECIKFECNEFVLVLVTIDLTHFEHSICISSTWIKTNTNPLVQLQHIRYI